MKSNKRPCLDIFPWGSDTENEEQPQQEQMAPAAMKVTLATPHCICYDLAPMSLAGKVLAHCQNCVQKLRFNTGQGSLQVVIYKIGITHDCESRFELYKVHNWTKMVVMAESHDLGFIEMLEAALILQHNRRVQCRNIQLGGEGLRDKNLAPKFKPPFYCYCVASRADVPRWVV